MAGSSSSSNDRFLVLPKNGLDTVLAAYGKQLRPGQSISFPLIKSNKAMFHHVDPVNAKTAPPSDFPLVAKFPESVVRPDLTRSPWLTGRFYEQDQQTVVDEDDEDDNDTDGKHAQRKRRRWGNSKDAIQRQWVLQEEAEFAETMMARKEHRNKTLPSSQGSSRYESTAEYNPSHYMMLELAPNNNTSSSSNVAATAWTTSSSSTTPSFQVTVLPTPYAVHTFSQPFARNALSLAQAEQVLQDHQNHSVVTRFMMHQKLGTVGLNHNNTHNSNGGNPTTTNINNSNILPRRLGVGRLKATSSSKARLLGKLKHQQQKVLGDDDDDDDDVMADVAFRNRKGGGGSRARKELLSSMADESVRVDDEGVLGGANDSEFGGKRHFGRIHVPSGANKTAPTGVAPDGAATSATGAEGMMLTNDFYQRDVQAEYDELDYDANEQFDDDDVDVGETEVVVDDGRGGGGGGEDDEHDPDALDDDEDDDDANRDVSSGGAEGLASLAGFRAMLAKARDRASPTNMAAMAAAVSAAGTNSTNSGGAAGTGTSPGTVNNNAADATSNLLRAGAISPNAAGMVLASSSAVADDTKLKDGGSTTPDGSVGVAGDDHRALGVDSSTIAAGGDNHTDGTFKTPDGKKKRKRTKDQATGDDVDDDTGIGIINMAEKPKIGGVPDVAAAGLATTGKFTGLEVDENGQRLLTMEAIRKEVWLNHGSIATKRLMQIFNIKSKSTADRREKFRALVRELCNVSDDPLVGRKLVLKQHYANLG